MAQTSIDVKQGDVLVVGGKEYPIKNVGDYTSDKLVFTRSFKKKANLTAKTLRNPGHRGGKSGLPVEHLTGLKCTPLDPVDSEIRQRVALDTPHELLQTMLSDKSGFVHLVIEDLKK